MQHITRLALTAFGAFLLTLALPATASAHCPGCSKGKSTDSKKEHKEHLHDIVDTAVDNGNFTILAKALTDTGLVEALKGKGPFTVFAPTDDAFKKLPEGTLASLSKDDLANILKAHVVSGKIMAKDAIAADGKEVTSLAGVALPVKVVDGKVTIEGATVVTADVKTTNGVIHVIDTVITP